MAYVAYGLRVMSTTCMDYIFESSNDFMALMV